MLYICNEQLSQPWTGAAGYDVTRWPTSCAGKVTEKVTEPFKDDGVIGKQFQDTEEGAAGVEAHPVLSARPPRGLPFCQLVTAVVDGLHACQACA